MEKLTISKAAKLFGKYTEKERQLFEKEFLEETVDKDWLTLNDWVWGKLQKTRIESKYPLSTYLQMSIFVSRFEGKSGLKYNRIGIEADVQEKITNIKNNGVEWVMEAVCGVKNCNHSKMVNGKQFPISDKDFNPAQLAHDDKCQRLSCPCEYCIVPKRDKDGMIIFKTSTGKIIKF